jgi:hypothetical protein
VARQLTDIVSLIRFALHQEDELVPFPEKVKARFANWIAQQESKAEVYARADAVAGDDPRPRCYQRRGHAGRLRLHAICRARIGQSGAIVR